LLDRGISGFLIFMYSKITFLALEKKKKKKKLCLRVFWYFYMGILYN